MLTRSVLPLLLARLGRLETQRAPPGVPPILVLQPEDPLPEDLDPRTVVIRLCYAPELPRPHPENDNG